LLFGDLPIYVAMDSADAWASRQLLQVDKSGKPERVAGVPADYFSSTGQLWGNPLYDWDVHAADNYDWWIGRIRHSAEMADLVRIDHFLGFESFFAIERGAKTARDGEWCKGPGDAIFDALRESLGEIPIVAEDLGRITPEVEDLRRRHRIPGMKVLQFEVLREDFDIGTVDDNCVCYTGTHDNDTTVGWYRGSSGGRGEERGHPRRQRMIRKACNGRASTIHTDMIRLAFSSGARLAIAPIQDYLGLGSEARLNTPGTIAKNWRWRLHYDQINSAVSTSVVRMVEDSRRNESA
jgi:4-alpha-glucanotransferase